MAQNNWDALSEAMRSDRDLRDRLAMATDSAEFERIAEKAGFDVTVARGSRELSDAELETVSGGYTFAHTDWIYCDNPWTDAYCTLKC